MEARAELLPDATGTGELARSRNHAPDGAATKLDASVQLALAVDVLGGLRRSLDAVSFVRALGGGWTGEDMTQR